MIYPLTFYTDKLIPDNAAGCVRVLLGIPFILIRPKYKDDEGLYQHELVHVKQAFKLPFIHPLLYAWSDKYRLNCEVGAYRKQAYYYADDRLSLFAGFISASYGLNISQNDAFYLLVNK